MLKWQADFLLATHTILECADRICLNAGTCLNFGALTSNGGTNEHCVCADDFFGANCEFTDDDLVVNGLSYDRFSISDDDNRSRRSSLVGDAELQEKSSEHSFEMKPDYGTQVETVEEIESQAGFADYFILMMILFNAIIAIILVFLRKWLIRKSSSRLGNEVMNVSGLNFRNGRCVVDRRESEISLIISD